MKRLGFLLPLGLVAISAGGCGGPPQIGMDEEAFKGVDALYTAVTSKRTDLLDQCDSNLKELKSAGKIPEPAHRALESIIAKARTGKWETATEELSTFMRGQRRGKR